MRAEQFFASQPERVVTAEPGGVSVAHVLQLPASPSLEGLPTTKTANKGGENG